MATRRPLTDKQRETHTKVWATGVVENVRTQQHQQRRSIDQATHQANVQHTAQAQAQRYQNQIDARNAANNKQAIQEFVTPEKGSAAKGISTGGGILRIGILGLVLIVVYVAVTAGKPGGSNASGVLGSISTWLSSLASTSPLFTSTATGSTVTTGSGSQNTSPAGQLAYSQQTAAEAALGLGDPLSKVNAWLKSVGQPQLTQSQANADIALYKKQTGS